MSIETQSFSSKEVKVSEPVPTTEELEVIVQGQEAPQSRVARMLQRVSQFAHGIGEKTSSMADSQQQRFEQNAIFDTYSDNIEATRSRERQETKDTLIKFGRSALGLPRRAYLEAKVQLAVGKEIITDARDAVVTKANETKDAILDKADFVRDTVNGAIETTVDKTKQGYDAVSGRVDSFTESVSGGMDTITSTITGGIEQGKAFVVGEYTAAKEKIADKREQLKQFFAERKAAALARKEARAALRLKNRTINERTVNVEVQKRLDEREARRNGRAALRAVTNQGEV